METPSTQSCPACGTWWRLPLLLAVVLGAILLSRRLGDQQPNQQPNPQLNTPIAESRQPAATETVSLGIDTGDGNVREFPAVAWHTGITALDLLRATPRADLRIVIQGAGASALLVELNGLKNEGAGGRNWTYTVNGQFADRSAAVYELNPDDRVLWTFALPK